MVVGATVFAGCGAGEGASVTAVDPAAYAGSDGNHFFRTPSGRPCGIINTYIQQAGCHGQFPGAPEFPAGGNVMRPPNQIYVGTDGDGQLQHRGDAIYYPPTEPREAPVLPAQHVLTVDGFECTVEDDTTVTCTNTATGHGFTASETSYSLS